MTSALSSIALRASIVMSIAMLISLILLINLAFKITLLNGMIISLSALISALITLIYLISLSFTSLKAQRILLNQSLMAVYLFSIGIYLLVNLPAAEFMHNNPAYQVVFVDIPKKFFATTLAFVLSFYIPHQLVNRFDSSIIENTRKRILFVMLSGFVFFNLNFFLLFVGTNLENTAVIYFDSVLINSVLIMLISVGYLIIVLIAKKAEWNNRWRQTIPPDFSLGYQYLLGMAVTLLLICLACEYRLISLGNGWTLVASSVLFPLIIALLNLVNELYDYQTSIRMSIILILAALSFDLLLTMAVTLPAPTFFNLNPYYSFILPRRIIASSLALIVTLSTNLFFLEFLRRRIHWIQLLWLRFLIANLISGALLCLINYSLLFGGIYPYEAIYSLLVGGLLYKILATILCLPPTLWLYRVMRRARYQSCQIDRLMSGTSRGSFARPTIF